MNTAEIKLNLFREIDNLKDEELEKVYQKIIDFLGSFKSKKPELTPELKSALDKGMESIEKGDVFTHEEVMKEMKDLYPDLNF